MEKKREWKREEEREIKRSSRLIIENYFPENISRYVQNWLGRNIVKKKTASEVFSCQSDTEKIWRCQVEHSIQLFNGPLRCPIEKVYPSQPTPKHLTVIFSEEAAFWKLHYKFSSLSCWFKCELFVLWSYVWLFGLQCVAMIWKKALPLLGSSFPDEVWFYSSY